MRIVPRATLVSLHKVENSLNIIMDAVVGTKSRGSSSSNSQRKTGGGGTANGFKALGLSDHVYRGIVKMGFRVSLE